ncbi:MAG TPA: FlgD immunoglobulin-like domain containing protein [Candidatus Eisenbacteria bacterium]
MIPSTHGRWRAFSRIAMAGCLLAGLPATARSAPEVVAVRGIPSAVAATYGPAVPLPAIAPGTGVTAVPTGSGVEFLATNASPSSVARLGTFRTAGTIRGVAGSGANVFLFAGTRGVLALDATDPAAATALSSIDGLGAVALGAAAAAGPGLVAASDSTLHFLNFDPATGFTLARSVTYADGRRVAAVAVQSDSFLVASNRPGILPRLILTLYRFGAGMPAPDSLAEFAFNAHEVSDLAWRGPRAFLADGNRGVLILNVPSRAIVRTVPVQGSKFVRSVDAGPDRVVATAEGRTVVSFARAGAALDSLVLDQTVLTELEPIDIRLTEGPAAVSTVDQATAPEPDEIARSQVEFVDPYGLTTPPPPVGDVGRTRRVVVDAGLAYVADYSGGLRIYRAGGADSSLVGVLPEIGNARAVDVALDPSRSLAYLASGPGGLEIVDVRDPAAPARITSLVLPGLASAVTVAGQGLVAVGRRGSGSAGVTFVDVSDSTLPSPRGSVNAPLSDPRALAARDTVLFVADEQVGLASIGFGNPDLPRLFGVPSGTGSRALDLTGATLLVGTRAEGLEVVDALDPSALIRRATLPTPPILGIARSAGSAALLLGDAGALVVDVQDPNAPSVRGPVGIPGVSRGGAWVGDTLVVAAGLGLERYEASPSSVPVPSLAAALDPGSALPRAVVSWSAVSVPGMVGLNLYRDLGAATAGTSNPSGRLVNRSLLAPSARSAVDDSLTAGAVHRYRLEAFFADGSALKVAEGSLYVPSSARVGRPYPNPFRPRGGAAASIPYRVPARSPAPRVTLRIYDMRGRLVRTVTGVAPATGGFGALSWDGRDDRGRMVADGIFFLHLSGAGLDDARALTLLH